jgi:hypothetical protein
MTLPTKTNTDEIVNELKIATGWQKISYVNGSYVIGFTLGDMQTIKGLDQGQGCFVLNFPAFENLPLSFHVTSLKQKGNVTTYQYWTINGRMHRADGKPSYVSYDEENDRIIRRWHWNGLLHRVDGPAKEMIKGFRFTDDLDGYNNHIKEDWNLMTLEWWKEGFQCKFPDPQEATIEAGWRLRNKKTGKIDSPRADLSAWGSDYVTMRWDTSTKDEATDMFVPLAVEIDDLIEWYQDGVLKDRTCARSDFQWVRNGRVINDTLTKFDEAIRTSLIADLGIWQGPFYPSSEVEFLMLSEYERVGKDTE